MTVLHSGSNTKYSSNWAKAFAKGAKAKSAASMAGKKPAAGNPSKRSAKPASKLKKK